MSSISFVRLFLCLDQKRKESKTRSAYFVYIMETPVPNETIASSSSRWTKHALSVAKNALFGSLYVELHRMKDHDAKWREIAEDFSLNNEDPDWDEVTTHDFFQPVLRTTLCALQHQWETVGHESSLNVLSKILADATTEGGFCAQ